MEKTDCCGLCDIDVCKNKKCPRWKKAYEREENRRLSEEYGFLQALIHEDAGDRIYEE